MAESNKTVLELAYTLSAQTMLKALQKKGLSQKKLASLLDVNQSTVCRLIKGSSPRSTQLAVRIAGLYNSKCNKE